MIRSHAVTKSRSDSFQQLQQRCALLFKRFRNINLQRGRGWRSLGEGKNVNNEVLEWKPLKRTLVRRRDRQLSEAHERRTAKMLQHRGYVHASPLRGG